MNKILKSKNKQDRENNASYYATAEDFQRFFAAEMTDLFWLGLLLTADAEDTERVLILAMRDCSQNDTVAKEWIRAWVHRAVICQAVQVVLVSDSTWSETILNRLQPQFELSSAQYAKEAAAESLVILSLPKLERLVFVICRIERYSIQDCSILLSTSAAIVRAALRRVASRVVDFEMLRCDGAGAGTASNGAAECDSSCGLLPRHSGSGDCYKLQS